jgi:nickel-dependent lactate racemase
LSEKPEPAERAMHELADLDGLCTRLCESLVRRGLEVEDVAPSDPPPIDLTRALASTLAKPTGTPPLRELARGVRKVAIITADATRATPTAMLLGPVMEQLTRAGVPVDGVDVIIGVGAHRPATRDEIGRLLGAEWAARLRVTNHDARAADLAPIGRTSSGAPLLVNRLVAEADLRIAFGQVEPHEFAGFTGGRKAILPSVAGYESIVRNHALSMLLAPTARPGVLEGNPIHEEMLAAARLARLDFVVNVALDRESRPVAVAAEDVGEAHRQLVAFLRRHFEVAVPDRPASLIVTGPGAPLDINLYQTIKPLVGIEPLLDADRDGAPAPVVVLFSRCWDGAGSDEMFVPFRQAREALACEGTAGPSADALSQAVVQGLAREYTIEMDESYFIARVTPKCRAVIAACPGVPDELLRLLGWEPADDAESALARALELVGERASTGQVTRHGKAAGLAVSCPRAQRALFV